MMTAMEEAKRYAARAEENYVKAAMFKDANCRMTMISLAEQYERMAAQAVAAAQFEPDRRDEEMMLSKGGLHPYDEMLFFCLRDFRSRGPKSRAAVIAGDVTSVSERPMVRMLARGFNKSSREVARDLIRLDRSLENGQP